MPTHLLLLLLLLQAAAAAGISAALVKELREASGAGMMDCKKALAECDGDIEKAKEVGGRADARGAAVVPQPGERCACCQAARQHPACSPVCVPSPCSLPAVPAQEGPGLRRQEGGPRGCRGCCVVLHPRRQPVSLGPCVQRWRQLKGWRQHQGRLPSGHALLPAAALHACLPACLHACPWHTVLSAPLQPGRAC